VNRDVAEPEGECYEDEEGGEREHHHHDRIAHLFPGTLVCSIFRLRWHARILAHRRVPGFDDSNPGVKRVPGFDDSNPGIKTVPGFDDSKPGKKKFRGLSRFKRAGRTIQTLA
jgi:hypothetical protein